MFTSYKFADCNQEAYIELCKKISRSDGLFQCQHQDWIKRVNVIENVNEQVVIREKAEVINNKQKKRSDSSSKTGNEDAFGHVSKRLKSEQAISLSFVNSDLGETHKSGTLDFKALQKSFVANINSSANFNFSALQSIDHQTICESDISSPTDEVLIQVCKKCEKLNEDVVNAVCTLLILPKMYHLASKLSASTCNALSDFIQWHPSSVVMQALIPLLQFCPEMQEQHRDALTHLIQNCSPALITQMLCVISMRKTTSDIDIQIFQLLCQKSDPQAEATHAAILSFLSKALDSHKNSIKLGHCLLYIIKTMGSIIRDYGTLEYVVSNHNSSMKKAIEVQLKKKSKNR